MIPHSDDFDKTVVVHIIITVDRNPCCHACKLCIVKGKGLWHFHLYHVLYIYIFARIGAISRLCLGLSAAEVIVHDFASI